MIIYKFPCTKFSCKIILHLVLIIIFYTRTHIPSISYYTSVFATAAAINHVTEEPAAFVVTTFIARYGKQLLVKYSRFADAMERTVISLTP